ncbi:hypothetical protein HQ447_13310, partial [bacterium]|nr:hypothetical protein [bacterium]
MKSLFALLLAPVLPLSAVPLSGTRTVGPAAADYPSLTAAIADIQSNSVGGALLLELQPDYLSSVETFPLLVPTLSGVSAANPLIIRPALGATALRITSGDPTAATVDLNGARFVTFEGRAGGAGTSKQLVIANTSTSGRALRFINDANGNVLRHLTLEGVNSSASSGTVVFSSTTGANGNDNNTLDFCDLRDGQTPPANALYSSGSTGTTAQNNSGNTVSNCNVFNFYSGTSDAAGVRLDGGNADWSIANNSFYQTASRAAVAASVRAIHVENPSGVNFTLTGNFIGGTEPGAGGAPWTTTGSSAAYRFVGIQLNVGSATPSSVQGNSIKNMVWTSSMDTTTLPGLWCGIYALAGNVNIGTVAGNLMGGGTGTGSISVTTSLTGGTAIITPQWGPAGTTLGVSLTVGTVT